MLRAVVDTNLKVEIFESINDCRDPKANIVLECAAAGKADYIITGDKDLRCDIIK